MVVFVPFIKLRRILKLPKEALIGKAISWLKICRIVPSNLAFSKRVHRLISQYDFRLFDAIVVAGTLEAGCTILYSEDTYHGPLAE